jgi:two-component system sensor histidine kinase AlgZ
VEWDLDELPEQAPLPLLVLQPLVENAVYHGVEPSSDVGVVRIAGRFREKRVNLSVRNSLPAANAAQRHRKGNHMALDNVRQRMAAMFSEHASLTVSWVEDEFQVRMVFPYPAAE